MTTFSDCMTLLLTFFVLLLSFSVFDEMALKRLLGALDYKSLPSLEDNEQDIDDTLEPTVESIVDRTEKGAEKRTSESIRPVRVPKAPESILDADAYKDERILYIPTRRLFLGKSNVLSRRGRDSLKAIASFMELVPCKVIISEIGSYGSQSTSPRDDVSGLRRSWAVLELFTQQQRLSPERFYIAAGDSSPGESLRNESVMQITLLAWDITQ